MKCILFGVIFTIVSDIFPRSNGYVDNAKVVADGKVTAHCVVGKACVAFARQC